MNVLKEREWLKPNENMQDLSPKEYYRRVFKEIVKEIKENENNTERTRLLI